MDFNMNAPVLYVIVGAMVAVVLGQSVFFLVKAWRRGLAIGMNREKLTRIARTTAVFTIAPAIAIVISVITLAKALGVPLPWLRLSVIGNLSYETIAASNALSSMGLVLGQVSSLTAKQYITIASVMTVSIMVGIWLVPVFGEKILKGMSGIEKRDKKWGEILSASLFLGLISAFIGYVFCDFGLIFKGDSSGLIPVAVFVVSALVMAISGLVYKKKPGWHWINDYALPISLVVGMVSAIPITAWLG